MKLLFALIASFFFAVGAFANDAKQYQLSTHILDINTGKPASGVDVRLEKMNPKQKQWIVIDHAVTDANGRIATFLPKNSDNTGTYKLVFETNDYFASQNQKSIYPFVEVVFLINEDTQYHIPITMSANGYATYRGN